MGRKTTHEIEAQIVAARLESPTWGARKLKASLERKGVAGLPSASTITQILRRHELLNPELTGPRDSIRFEKEEPNMMWQMDFKGDFAIKGGRCYPFTLLDDHSRYLLSTHACGRHSMLVESYENVHYPIGLPPVVDAIKVRMEDLGLTAKDLQPLIGTPARVADILNSRRQLSLSNIRKLHEGLGLPLEILIQKQKLKPRAKTAGRPKTNAASKKPTTPGHAVAV